MIARLLCLLLLAFAAIAATAQDNALAEPRFWAIGDNRSISDGVVTALAQDETGLLWVGTPVGLVRYDGYQLKPLGVGDGSSQLAGTSFVRSIVAAPGGQLWVGLEKGGLARLDIASSAWTLYRSDAADPGALAAGSVRALARDLDGTLWVGTLGGLDSLADGANAFRHHRHATGALPDDRIQALRVDRRGDLWVGTWNGLVRRRRGSAAFERVFSAPADGLGGKVVSMLAEAPDGRIWVGTRRGELAIVDPQSGEGRWIHDALPSDSGDRNAYALTMLAIDDDEVWIGRTNGLERRSARDGRVLGQLQRDLRKPWGLASNHVAAMLRDAAGGVWVGS